MHDEPIGPQPAVDIGSGVGAVHVDHIPIGSGAEQVEVQMGILCDKRVVGPVAVVDPQVEKRPALVPLQLWTDPASLRVLPDGQHVGPVDEAALPGAADSENETQHPLALESAGNHAADLLRDLPDGHRDKFRAILSPGVPLELHELAEVAVGLEWSVCDAHEPCRWREITFAGRQRQPPASAPQRHWPLCGSSRTLAKTTGRGHVFTAYPGRFGGDSQTAG